MELRANWLLPSQVHGPTPSFCSGSPGMVQVVVPQVAHSALASSPRLCGQCDTYFCELYCNQCNEFFCRSCVTTMHSRGQMLKHEIVPYDSDKQLMHYNNGICHREVGDSLTSNIHCQVYRTTCSIHNLALEYCCVTCGYACICAVCAGQYDHYYSGRHHQHEVVKVDEMLMRLPEEIGDWFRDIRLRINERTRASERVAQCESEVVESVCRAREEMRLQFEKLRSDLHEAEQDSLMAVTKVGTMAQDRCDTIFSISQSEAEVRATLESLQRIIGHPTVQTLHSFFKLESAITQPPFDEPFPKRLWDFKFKLRDDVRPPMITNLRKLCESPLLEFEPIEDLIPDELDGAFNLQSTKRSLVQEFFRLNVSEEE